MTQIPCFSYALWEKYKLNALRDKVSRAMRDRRAGQAELARQSGLSQGHLSKVLRSLERGVERMIGYANGSITPIPGLRAGRRSR